MLSKERAEGARIRALIKAYFDARMLPCHTRAWPTVPRFQASKQAATEMRVN